MPPTLTTLLLSLVLALGACAKDDPKPAGLDGRTDGGGDAADGGDAFNDGTPGCRAWYALVDVAGDKPSCVAEADDYRPADSSQDNWPACVSDDNTYHRLQPDISSIARVAGFEKIMAKLRRDPKPTAQDFVDARVVYSEPQGLDSRVSRREDEHYPAAANKCADMTPTEIDANPGRCVGQAKIQPLLNKAFADGASGLEPLVNAARIESGLLWFLYISTYKEAVTCTNTKKDCDSSYAYYTGGAERATGRGLSRYVTEVSRQTNDRVFDGILAVRCWRDLDPAVPAADLTRRDQALAQMDRALLRGIALLVKSRVAALPVLCDGHQQAAWTSAQILGAGLDREARARNATLADQLKTALQSPTPPSDTLTIQAAVEGLFPCP